MPYSRGEVILVRFPTSNPRAVTQRPALVVQADNLATGLSQSIVALITSNMARTGATRVPALKNSSAGRHMGTLMDSVIVTDNLATVLDEEVVRVLGTCPLMVDVDAALRVTLSL